jgi:hypothetical protein
VLEQRSPISGINFDFLCIAQHGPAEVTRTTDIYPLNPNQFNPIDDTQDVGSEFGEGGQAGM